METKVMNNTLRDHISNRAVKHAMCSFNEAIDISSSRVILTGIINNTNHDICTSSYHKKQLEDKYLNTTNNNNNSNNSTRDSSNRDRETSFSSSSIHEMSQQHPNGMCRPWNYDDFLIRLKTFHSTRYWFAKPSSISPIECALLGWVNTAIDEISCHCCGAVMHHNHSDDTTLLGSQQSCLLTSHASECAWRQHLGCHRSFTNIPVLSSSSSSPRSIIEHALQTIDQALIALIDHCGVDTTRHIHLDVNHDSLRSSASVSSSSVSSASVSSSSSSGVNGLIQQSLQTIHSDISSSASSSASIPSDTGIDSTHMQQLQSIISQIAKDLSSTSSSSSSQQSNESSVAIPAEYVVKNNNSSSSSISSATAATTATASLYDYIKSRFVDDCDDDDENSSSSSSSMMERRHSRMRLLSSIVLLTSCGWAFRVDRRRGQQQQQQQQVRMGMMSEGGDGGILILPAAAASAEEKEEEEKDEEKEEMEEEVGRNDAVVSHGSHGDHDSTESCRDDGILSLNCSLCGRIVCYDVNAVRYRASTTTTITTGGVGSHSHSKIQPFDPIHQHRYFCPWINQQSIVPTWFEVLTIITAPAGDRDDGNRVGDSSRDKRGADGKEEEEKEEEGEGAASIEKKIRGFEYYMCALSQFKSPAYVHTHAHTHALSEVTITNQTIPSVAHVVVAAADESSPAAAAVIVTAPTVATVSAAAAASVDVSPEQAYKRIRLILETASVK